MTMDPQQGLPTEDHNTNNNVVHNNNSLGLFSRTNQGFRLVGQQLLLWGPGVLDRRLDVGHVESHITSVTVWLRGPEQLGHPDTLQLEIWARPTRFMQR
jgi:hypothetical protein